MSLKVYHKSNAKHNLEWVYAIDVRSIFDPVTK